MLPPSGRPGQHHECEQQDERERATGGCADDQDRVVRVLVGGLGTQLPGATGSARPTLRFCTYLQYIF
eukprot:4587945-Prymnesium_polylepis.2